MSKTKSETLAVLKSLAAGIRETFKRNSAVTSIEVVDLENLIADAEAARSAPQTSGSGRMEATTSFAFALMKACGCEQYVKNSPMAFLNSPGAVDLWKRAEETCVEIVTSLLQTNRDFGAFIDSIANRSGTTEHGYDGVPKINDDVFAARSLISKHKRGGGA